MSSLRLLITIAVLATMLLGAYDEEPAPLPTTTAGQTATGVPTAEPSFPSAPTATPRTLPGPAAAAKTPVHMAGCCTPNTDDP